MTAGGADRSLASPLRLLVLAWLLAVAAIPAWARDLTPDENRTLGETVERFNAAMTKRDFAGIAQTVPPKVLQFIAASAGMEVEALRKVLMQQMAQALAEVRLTFFTMDLAKSERKQLPDGTPYVLIPTETVMEVDTLGKTAARSHTLALLDGGMWYLVRVSEAQQVAILRQVYPDFAGVEFSAGTMEAVE